MSKESAAAASSWRSGISVEAREWLKAYPVLEPGSISFEGDMASVMRELSAASFAAGIAAVRSEFSPHEEQINVGGIKCLRVTAGERTRPNMVILYHFGGGFHMGSPEEDLVVAAPMAAATGAEVIIPYYPLAPEHPYPAALHAVRSVYDALVREHAPSSLVLAGESAGGNLAMALLLSLRADGLALPTALGVMSPWADVSFSGHSHGFNDDPQSPFRTGQEAATIFGAYAGDADLQDPLVSPLFADFTGFPPTMITTGTRDFLMSDAVRVTNAMRADGVDVDLRVWEGMWHVFEFYREVPEARTSTQQVSEFLAARVDEVHPPEPA